MTRFGEGLAWYIWHLLDGQSTHTYQDLYERATEVEQVKSELRDPNPNPSHQKRKGVERGASSENVNVKKPAPSPLEADPQAQWNLIESVDGLTTPLLSAG